MTLPAAVIVWGLKNYREKSTVSWGFATFFKRVAEGTVHQLGAVNVPALPRQMRDSPAFGRPEKLATSLFNSDPASLLESYISALRTIFNCAESALLKTRRSRHDSRTLMHPKLGVRFAQ